MQFLLPRFASCSCVCHMHEFVFIYPTIQDKVVYSPRPEATWNLRHIPVVVAVAACG